MKTAEEWALEVGYSNAPEEQELFQQEVAHRRTIQLDAAKAAMEYSARITRQGAILSSDSIKWVYQDQFAIKILTASQNPELLKEIGK